jgi:hypothetical protein
MMHNSPASLVVRDKLGRITEKTENVNGEESVFSYAYDLSGSSS